MAYSAMQVANAFIDKKDKIPALTPMKLQKLMFFAQSWYLKMNNCRLINDEFTRWRYGPVIQSIYYEFAYAGGGVIEQKAKDFTGENVSYTLSPQDDHFIDRVIATYGEFSGWQLSEMTHDQKGAWAMNALGTVISNEEMISGTV